MDQTLHRVATKEREETKRTINQKMARRRNKEGGNHLEQQSNKQKAAEDTNGGLHYAVDGQSLSERCERVLFVLLFFLFSVVNIFYPFVSHCRQEAYPRLQTVVHFILMFNDSFYVSTCK